MYYCHLIWHAAVNIYLAASIILPYFLTLILAKLENKYHDTNPADLAEILRLISEGDQRAFALLVNKYADTIYSHCLAYVKSVEQAEELSQDIFLKIWAIRTKLKEIERFEDYLFVLSRNLIYRSFRKKVREMVSIAGGNVETDLESDLPTPDLQTEYRASYQLLLKGIDQLPEKRRQVFRMSRLDGMNHEQISQTLGIHKVTVAQYIVKSLNFLRSYLKEHAGDAILIIILLRGW